MSLSSNIRAGRAYVEVTAETSKLQRNLTSAQAQLQNFGRTCTNVGKDLLMLSGAMAAPLVMAARSFAGFDDSMRLVQAVTQATDADFKALTKTAQRLGRDTSYTAQQAADAMVSLGRMGFSPTEIQASIDAVLNLARSTGTELAEAGDIAANSMRIFGIEASQMSDVADVLTVTANSSAQTLIDLFEALKMGGPQAAAAGGTAGGGRRRVDSGNQCGDRGSCEHGHQRISRRNGSAQEFLAVCQSESSGSAPFRGRGNSRHKRKSPQNGGNHAGHRQGNEHHAHRRKTGICRGHF